MAMMISWLNGLIKPLNNETNIMLNNFALSFFPLYYYYTSSSMNIHPWSKLTLKSFIHTYTFPEYFVTQFRDFLEYD